MVDTETNRAFLRSLLHRECIYKEKFLIHPVQVAEVAVDERGVRLILDLQLAPGFMDPLQPCLDIGASWLMLHVGDRVLGAGQVGWTLVHRPELVDRIKTHAAEMDDPRRLLNFINRIAYSTAEPERAPEGDAT